LESLLTTSLASCTVTKTLSFAIAGTMGLVIGSKWKIIQDTQVLNSLHGMLLHEMMASTAINIYSSKIWVTTHFCSWRSSRKYVPWPPCL